MQTYPRLDRGNETSFPRLGTMTPVSWPVNGHFSAPYLMGPHRMVASLLSDYLRLDLGILFKDHF